MTGRHGTGRYEELDLWGPYRKHVLTFLDLKRKLRVAVDASNGMAGKMVPAVFGDIPNLQIVPLLFEITGSFVHEPNPLVESNLDMLKAMMAKRSRGPRRLFRRRRRPLHVPGRESQGHWVGHDHGAPRG